ncbi:hypothetical protein PM030_12325 [Halorubrum ezzemoulense]|uniref:hypothetical protein n=1 Tax=Halorubrum ezzemoulense TaxID=337243 RepID=UPI00232BC937|nr:hypothetical protein [Halorubrum ezzemoulense]MDB2282658.1 hypothetical protein [Halorubrum ezzemoulense]
MSTLDKAASVYSEQGAKKLFKLASENLYRQGYTTVNSLLDYGTHPYDKEWDVLIIIDACRFDLFQEFAPQHEIYDKFESVEPIYSQASSSKEWLTKTFVEGSRSEIANTSLIAANGFTSEIGQVEFDELEEVWRYGIHPDYHIVPPEPVTDAAVKCYRNTDSDRYVVHYNQPHAPFLHCAGKYDSAKDELGATQNVWDGLEKGQYDHSEVWEDYGKNLLDVLDHVNILVEDFSGKVAVSADHGNCLGEYGIYGHPSHCPVPSVRRVPWAVTEGGGKEKYELDNLETEDLEQSDDEEIKEHLSHLGYF